MDGAQSVGATKTAARTAATTVTIRIFLAMMTPPTMSAVDPAAAVAVIGPFGCVTRMRSGIQALRAP